MGGWAGLKSSGGSTELWIKSMQLRHGSCNREVRSVEFQGSGHGARSVVI
jgi:hypothetical protein